MSRSSSASAPLLDRTFEGVVFDWDGTAVPDRRASARCVRRQVEALCARSVDVTVVSGTHVGNVDGQLRARTQGPGRLFLALNRGSELFRVGPEGPRLVFRRQATTAEDAALDAAADALIRELEARGLNARVVSSRLNRRKVDLIPLPRWSDPPKAQIDELLDAVTARLAACGLDSLATVVEMAAAAGKEAGLTDPRITTDGKHVEIGLTDKSDSMRCVLREFATRGITPGLVLVAGDEFGELGGVRGSDELLMLPEQPRLTAVSVGVEPNGVPPGVRHLPGGPRVFRSLLDEQLRHRRRRRVPLVDDDPAWVVVLPERNPLRARAEESLLCLGDGVIGVRGSAEEIAPHESPLLLAAGVYTGEGSSARLLCAPWPLALKVGLNGAAERRVLDLQGGTLLREAPDDGLRTLRFVAAHRRGLLAERAEGAASALAPGPRVQQLVDPAVISDEAGTPAWARTTGTYGGIGTMVSQHVGRLAGMRTVERIAAHAADGRRPPSLARARTSLDLLKDDGFERLLAAHRAEWAARWSHTCVQIRDDPQAELASRFALFHLWNSVAGAAGEAAVGARGLSGPGYAGHVFWDTDVFVLPAVASMSPARARAILEYRRHRLPQAAAAARRLGLAGARFPWESASLGDDVTPTATRINGAWVPVRTGQQEEHIVADVAWAAGHYADWTGDRAYLTGLGRPLLVETARYWASRCVLEDGRAHIRHVIGPDEYHEDVDDNAYTNLMARWNLRKAASVVPASDERDEWLRIADALVDCYDAGAGRHEQFAGYSDRTPMMVAELGTPPLAADLLLGLDTLSRTQIVKQPDVLMAHHLLPHDLPPGSLTADLDYYLPRTAHGSSLSPAVAASLLARAGRPDDAMPLLDIALRMDLDDLTGMTAAGLHLATMGGVWQALLFGFAGLEVRDGALLVNPQLPARWGGLTLRFRCLGKTVEAELLHDSGRVTTTGPMRIGTPRSAPRDLTREAHLSRTDEGWTVTRP